MVFGGLGRYSDEQSPDALLIELWPSPAEIYPDDPPDYYFTGLRGFYDSLRELRDDAHKANFELERYTDYGTEQGEPLNRASPPEIVQYIVQAAPYFISGGGAVALYKILKIWADIQIGRKYTLKVGDIGIDATGVPPRKFEKLIQKTIEVKEQLQEQNVSQQDLKTDFSEFPILSEEERDRQQRLIRHLFWDSITRVKGSKSSQQSPTAETNVNIPARLIREPDRSELLEKLTHSDQLLEDLTDLYQNIQEENRRLREEIKQLKGE